MERGEGMSGCEYMKCQYVSIDTKGDPICHYERPICFFKESEHELSAEIERLKEAIKEHQKVCRGWFGFRDILNETIRVCEVKE